MDIMTVVESYGIELKKAGKLYVCFCPFHDDKNTPNFYIYPNTNSWYCFKENMGGDVIAFIAKMEHVERDQVKKKMAFDLLKQKSDVLKPRKATDVNFKPSLLRLASRDIYNYIHKHPHKLDLAMRILKKFDEAVNLNEEVSYKRSTELLEKLKKHLYNI